MCDHPALIHRATALPPACRRGHPRGGNTAAGGWPSRPEAGLRREAQDVGQLGAARRRRGRLGKRHARVAPAGRFTRIRTDKIDIPDCADACRIAAPVFRTPGAPLAISFQSTAIHITANTSPRGEPVTASTTRRPHDTLRHAGLCAHSHARCTPAVYGRLQRSSEGKGAKLV